MSAILVRIVGESDKGCLTVDLTSMTLQPKDFADILSCEWQLSNQKRRGKQ